MAAPANITVFVNQEEFSKFERDKNEVIVNWTATGGGDMTGEQLLV